MPHMMMLLAGGAFLAVLLFRGWRLRRAGRDVKGRAPIARPAFLAGKTAMGLLWGLALWQAAAAVLIRKTPAKWVQAAGAVLFAAGCGVAVVSFGAIGRELRFGLPGTECRLKTSGIYGWSRHPMYTGFFLMAFGAGLYVGTPLPVFCLLVAVGVHHRIALAEERFMDKHFGVAWQAYIERVPRYGSLRLGHYSGSEKGHG